MGERKNQFNIQKPKKMIALCFLAVIIFFLTFLKGGSLFAGGNRENELTVTRAESGEEAQGKENASASEDGNTKSGNGRAELGENKSENEDRITVDVEGAVNNPGVLLLKKDVRVYEAITSAGGLTAEADLREINQAEILLDGEKLYIPRKSDYAGGNGTAQTGQQSRTSDSSAKKINLNTADSAKLQTLKGIGPSMAERILQYRAENGKFKSVDELKNVKGIGAKTFEKLREYVTVT